MTDMPNNNETRKKENPFINLICNVVIPSVILTKFSSEEYLGQVNALIIALAFPLIYGAWDFISQRKFNWIAAIGLISVLLTGGIGLFQLNKTWMIVKETALPLVIGLFVLASQFTKKPLVKTLIEQIFDLEKIHQAMEEKNIKDDFDQKIYIAGFYFSCTFFLSAVLNYVLAVIVLKGSPGSVEFNESLGRMTALSFPVISIPTVIATGFIIFGLVNYIKKQTDLPLEAMVKQQ
ncbi:MULTISPECIES: VC0807 family protein [Halobacteriovorax]|uniref:MFS transporter n=1 Tax=Halobacteriovorax vibrionivorans TaxID=2152716 RepID=A0ABY0IEK4_9BACT|nr:MULTISPECIES: VC0807 family protein [Halobacteriovorax]AYF44852.1 intracellular septation protein A-like protein [Halobacteriovorax sp. BALOs_7]RZF20930.1 MFS transporter [Halobacteriovorax vibrionivorans]TGD46030.1 MFS transporter [Halobacteriovorax sp. Y22]